MPISLLPEDRRLFWLAVDKDIPLEKRPVFVCKSPTRKITLQWVALFDECKQISKGPKVYAKLHEMIALGVTDWRNFDKPFSPAALDEVLSNDELQELAVGWPEAFKLTEDERKNSGAPQRSTAAQSAESVMDNATSRQRKPSRSSSNHSPANGAPAKAAKPASSEAVPLSVNARVSS